MEKPNNQVAVEITNQMIYEEIQNIKACINGNGKKGLRQTIGELAVSVRLQWGFISFIMVALVGGAIKLFM